MRNEAVSEAQVKALSCHAGSLSHAQTHKGSSAGNNLGSFLSPVGTNRASPIGRSLTSAEHMSSVLIRSSRFGPTPAHHLGAHRKKDSRRAPKKTTDGLDTRPWYVQRRTCNVIRAPSLGRRGEKSHPTFAIVAYVC